MTSHPEKQLGGRFSSFPYDCINRCKSDRAPLHGHANCVFSWLEPIHDSVEVRCTWQRWKSRARPWLKFEPSRAFLQSADRGCRFMLGSRKAIPAFWLPGFVQRSKDAGRAGAEPATFHMVPVWARTGFG